MTAERGLGEAATAANNEVDNVYRNNWKCCLAISVPDHSAANHRSSHFVVSPFHPNRRAPAARTDEYTRLVPRERLSPLGP